MLLTTRGRWVIGACRDQLMAQFLSSLCGCHYKKYQFCGNQFEIFIFMAISLPTTLSYNLTTSLFVYRKTLLNWKDLAKADLIGIVWKVISKISKYRILWAGDSRRVVR